MAFDGAGANAPDDETNTEISVEEVEFASRTLLGDMTDQVLELYKRLPRAWTAMSEAQQTDAATRVRDICLDALTRGNSMMAARGRVTIIATLEAVKIAKGIEGKVVVSRQDDQRHLLFDRQGSDILIVLTDVNRFLGERGPAKAIMPDQVPLPLEAMQIDPNVEGQEAGRAGKPATDNPHPSGTPANDRWRAGWTLGIVEFDQKGPPPASEISPKVPYGQPPEPYEQGHLAALNDQGAEDNPYEAGSDDGALWRQGWLAGRDTRDGGSSSVDGAEPDSITRALNLGKQGWKLGKDRAENLYPAETPEAEAWLKGWDEAEAEADAAARADGADPEIPDNPPAPAPKGKHGKVDPEALL